MHQPQVLAYLISTSAVAMLFWTHASGTDVTIRLVDQDRVPIPESVFVIDGSPVAQDGVIALSAGTHSVTALPGKTRDAEATDLYCNASITVAGATQLVELVWRPSHAHATVSAPAAPGARPAGPAGGAPAPLQAPKCFPVTDQHFTLTITDDKDWTYRPGRSTSAKAHPLNGDPAVAELARQIAGIARVLAAPDAYGTSMSFQWMGARRTDEEWMNTTLAALGDEAQVFLKRAESLQRHDPELLERFRSLQTRLHQAWGATGTGAAGVADVLRRDLASRRLSALEDLLERMEELLAQP